MYAGQYAPCSFGAAPIALVRGNQECSLRLERQRVIERIKLVYKIN
jgi:hypothetical protein